MEFIYLDNNATTQPSPGVVAAMRGVDEHVWANPSSIHRPGQAARQKIELARKSLALLIGARPRQITLVGSGTEAIDLAIRGGLRARLASGGPGRDPGITQRRGIAIVTTRAEHSAVRELAADLERFGLDGVPVRVHWASMRSDGCVDADAFEKLLESDPTIVLASVQWANNETGAVQPVAAIGHACHRREGGRGGPVLFHCDATQWVGKHPIDAKVGPVDDGFAPNEMPGDGRLEGTSARPPGSAGAGPTPATIAPESVVPVWLAPFDFLTFSAHKFHGPKGVGVLWMRPGARVAPMIHGEQELGRRGGTENTSAIAGAGVAAEEARAWLDNPARLLAGRALRDRFEREVVEGAIGAGVDASVNGPSDPNLRLWNTSSIAFSRLEAEALLLLLSERGVCCSAGAACSSGSLEPSSVLLATGIPPERAHGSLRFSLSRLTTAGEIDRAVRVIVDCVTRLRGSMGAMM